MTLSNITLSGTISKDAEQRYTPNNNSVISFMMQIVRYDNREKTEKSYPVKVNLWGDNYTDLVDKLKPAARVLISGRLEVDQFVDRAGKNVRLVVVEANSIHLIDSLKNPTGAEALAVAGASSPAAEAAFEDMAPVGGSEEIPF